jgi:hypothetical protein
LSQKAARHVCTSYGTAILSAIKAWTFDPQSPITVQAKSLTFKPAITLALRNQNSIGWIHLFRGFISIDWRMISSKTDPTPSYAHTTQANRILPGIIKALQNYTISLWKSRYETLHASGADGLSTVYTSLNSDISQLYALKDTFSPITQSYF